MADFVASHQADGPGVYMIRCTQNAKVYIGSSSKSVIKRRTKHFTSLRAGTHHAKDLQADFNLFGENAFSFEVIEFCVSEETANGENAAITAHDATNPAFGYNCRRIAYVRSGRPKVAASIKVEVMSIGITPKRRKKITKRAKRLGLSVSEAIGRLIDEDEG